MALKWIGGDLATGAASEQNVLPVTSGSDKVTVDVNAGDTASLSLSKRDLGSNWQDSIAEGVTLVALVDDAQAWNSPAAVLFAGWVDKATGKVGDAIQLEIAGLREYLAARIISPYSNGGTTNQNEGIQFKADTWQGIMASIVSNAFAPLVGSPVQPPTILGNVDGVQSGTAKIRGVRLVDAEDYAKCLDNIRDVLSDVGNEYRLIPRWSDSTKTFIVWDVAIGNETDGKLNWAGTNTNIVLDASTYANLTFSLTRDSKGMANRVIGQSTTGTTGTTGGADYTVVTQANGKPLFDVAFNAGKLLTQAEMQAQLAARIADLKTPKGSATYEVSGNAADWLPLLGSKLSFSGGTDIDSTGYDTVVRLTNLDFSSSDSKISITVMLPQSRYPALPSLDKVDNLLGPGGSGDNSYGANIPPSGGYKPPNYTPPSYSPWDKLEPPYIAPVETVIYEPGLWSSGYQSYSILQWDTVKKGGTLYAWGDTNSNGQLGYGNTNPSLKPAPVASSATDWIFCQTGDSAAMGIRRAGNSTTQGTLWLWGAYKSAPQTTFPNQVGTDTDWVQICYASTSAFGDGTIWGFLALKADGTLWKVYDFNTVQQMTGLPLYASIDSRFRNSAGIYGVSKAGNLILSGQEDTSFGAGLVKSFARTYDFNSTTREFVIKTDKTLWSRDNGGGAWTQFGTDKNWEFISGGYYCVGAINSKGDCYMQGQAGNGVVYGTITKIAGISGASRCYFSIIDGGGGSSFILDSQGLWVVGYNGFGMLGTGDEGSRGSWVLQG